MWCVVNRECQSAISSWTPWAAASAAIERTKYLSILFPSRGLFFSVSARAAHLTRQVGWRRVRERALNRNSYPGAIEIGRATSPAPSGLRSKQVDTSMHREITKLPVVKRFPFSFRRLDSHRKKSSMLLMFLKFRSHYI